MSEAAARKTSVGPQGSRRRYFHALWLLTGRDLRVKYATTWLGYAWTILDPLMMCGVYMFLFVVILGRTGGVEPYGVFLITGLLPWQWFTTAVNESGRAFLKDKKLLRSTGASNSMWVMRVVVSSGFTYVLSLPVVAAFLLIMQVPIGAGIVWWPVAFITQGILLTGIGLLMAPLCILINDLSKIVGIIVRFLFFASPILFDHSRLPDWLSWMDRVNPLYGIMTMYRLGYWPELWNGGSIVAAISVSIAILALGIMMFPILVRPVLKDL
ncbi:ABC transporter permease [Microbacterium indicum]|uniref:ABC transporter permease n=1 Tax=Microbacterium indicum TaxID=358100 RepID=UPI0004901EBE|nr:ABC transporter permease [Microbacterium indicum]